MNAKRLTALLLIILSFAMPLSSCSESADGDTGKIVEFTDALGRKVSVPKAPKRVAALIGSFADVWQLAGGTLCASADDAWDELGLDMGDAVNIGGAHSPNMELLIASCPDLVIASASTASNVEMKDSLEAMGITVAYFDIDNFYDYLAMLDICTDITGRKDLYRKNGLDIKESIDAVKKDIASADIPEEKRTVLLLRASSGSVKAKGSYGTVLGEMLRDLGCINIADSDKSLLEDLSAESVIEKDPYFIFTVTMGNDTEAAKASLYRLIAQDSAWSTLTAVKEERIYIMDRKLFNLKPNARWAEAYRILYEILEK